MTWVKWVKWTHSVMCNSLRPHGLQPTKFLHAWDFPGKSTGVGCNFLLCQYSFSAVQSLSRVWLFATPWTAACQASLSITNSRSYPNSCPLSKWCHPTISSSVVPFSSCLQSFPASGSLQMIQFFTSGGKVLEFQLQHQSFSEYSGLNICVNIRYLSFSFWLTSLWQQALGSSFH